MVSSRPQNHHSSGSFGNGSPASVILGAFGRRPRTATNGSNRSGQPTDYAESTEDLTPNQTNRSRINLSGRNGLPRSSSSSQVNRLSSTDGGAERSSRFAFPSSTSFLGDSRRPNMASQGSSASLSNSGLRSADDINHFSNNAIQRVDSSQGTSTGGGGSAIGRYLRRYSQGAGKNMAAANEAHAIAASVVANTNNAQSGSSNIRSNNVNYQSGSVLTTSQTMPVLPMPNITSSPLHSTQELVNTEGAIAASMDMMTGVESNMSAAAISSATPDSTAATHRIRLVPHLEATRSLHFEPIERDLVEGAVAVKIGRFTDRAQASSSGVNGSGPDSVIANAGGNGSFMSTQPTSSSSMGVPGARGGAIPSSAGGGGRVDSGRIAFKSKVVSRGHAEVWCEGNGKFFIRDTKSSSGTFLNHIRLSHPNVESKPFPVKDGDVVQLGVDYQGGTEEIYRCVKMRVELNRGWQRGANQFNVNALRQLRALQGTPLPEPGGAKATSALPTNRQSMNITDCCICLFSVTVCQALFIAPCSHVYHFKCIRPLIEQHHPGFSCPLCRTFADLNADVEEDEAWQQALLREAQFVPNLTILTDLATPIVEETSMNLVASEIPSNTRPHSNVDSGNSSNSSPRNPSSLRRAVHHTEDEPFTSNNDKRQSSASHASHRSENDPPLVLQRPDTAVSSTSVASLPAYQYTGHSLRNVITSNTNHSHDERDEEQEVIHEESLSSNFVQDRRPSVPIPIQPASQQASIDGFSASPGFLDARTPMNDLFLSTLAEVPPPSRYSLQAMEPSSGDSTLFPNMMLAPNEEMERRLSNASSQHGGGTSEAFVTPAQGNSPPGGGSSPMSATAQSQYYEEDGNNVGSNASSSLAHHPNPKGKSNSAANMQGAIDFLAGGDQSVNNATTTTNTTTTATTNRGPRNVSLVGSAESTDRNSCQNSSQETGRQETEAPSKVARFFKRNSSAIGN